MNLSVKACMNKFSVEIPRLCVEFTFTRIDYCDISVCHVCSLIRKFPENCEDGVCVIKLTLE
jgi:hypothetical protein